jgi:hypothetical protein
VVELTVGVAGGTISSHEFTIELPAGSHGIAAHFTNDFGDANSDRNLIVYDFRIVGPLGGVAGDSSNSPTRVSATTVMQRMLLRPINDEEVTPVLGLLQQLSTGVVGSNRSAWTGVCEALFQHPDFLFTRPPSAESNSRDSPAWERSLVIKSALDLMNRTPTEAELQRFDAGLSRLEMVNEWLLTDDYLNAYRNRVREVLEYNGTPDGEEPARLWAYVMDADKPIKEILTAAYTVDDNLQQIERPAAHGQTGVLTMKGYISGKPGLPHYNYAARVFTGFMGTVFVVPQEALDARATATPASTVDPGSVCYSCHRVLTPLSHQRLAWDDDGNFRTTDEQGVAIDDSDRGMVEGYPYAGAGMESFSLVAVRKEAFARRMANLHFLVSFGRAMREEADERDVYQGLYAAMDAGNGTFRDLVRAIHMSRSYVRPVTGQGG